MNLSFIKGNHVGLPMNIYLDEASILPDDMRRVWFQTNYEREGTITDIWSMNLQGELDSGYKGIVKQEDIDKLSIFIKDNQQNIKSLMNGEIDIIDFCENIAG